MENQSLVCVVEDEPFGDLHLSESIAVVDAEIEVYGKLLRFRVGVQDWMMPMSALVPVARTICDKLLNAVLDYHKNKQQAVSCRKGCAACCSYLVGLSMPEVFQVRKELSLMPADDRLPILKSSVYATRTILKQQKTLPRVDDHADQQQISDWYMKMNLRCPLLQNGLCSIYDQRPLACREYFVQSTPDWCFTGQTHNPDPVPVRLPFSVAELLGQVAADIEGTQEQAVILPLALIGTDEISHRSKRLWPAVEMAEYFVRALEEKAYSTSMELCQTNESMY
ncbi:MAG: YkgJ family cysteine cluster protein [Planctomycetota bacterium]|jgi:Fe-S-cluster containining protein